MLHSNDGGYRQHVSGETYRNGLKVSDVSNIEVREQANHRVDKNHYWKRELVRLCNQSKRWEVDLQEDYQDTESLLGDLGIVE